MADNKGILMYGLDKSAWVESNKPEMYRLAKDVSGTLVLQGLFWRTNSFEHKSEWRTIPTVMLEAE